VLLQCSVVGVTLVAQVHRLLQRLASQLGVFVHGAQSFMCMRVGSQVLEPGSASCQRETRDRRDEVLTT
jgi:hypothetical protein